VWVSRHPLNNSLAVFVHGIWGSRWTTWRSYLDFFQRLPTDRPELRSYDVYIFNYRTPFFGQEPPLRESVVPRLRMFLEKQAARYDTIALICHSQGGLLVKMYLLEELLNNRGERLKVDLVVTLNTPHRGADWRNPVIIIGLALAWCLKAPVVRKFYLLRQLADLAPNSSNVRFLEEHWDDRVSTVPGWVEPGRKYVKSIAICGLQDWLVSRRSGEGFYVDEKNATFNGHPVNSEELARYVGYLLAGYENPAKLNKELEQIYSDRHRLAQHRGECMNEASTIMSAHDIGPPSFVNARAHCFAHEFKEAFARHPLRKLPLMDAFRSYVRRMLLD
jgi:pimeloyl-ACP methyl ester carboxylesterase